MKLFGFSSFAFNCRPSSWKHRWIGVCKWKRNEILFESTLYMIHSSTWDETNKHTVPFHWKSLRTPSFNFSANIYTTYIFLSASLFRLKQNETSANNCHIRDDTVGYCELGWCRAEVEVKGQKVWPNDQSQRQGFNQKIHCIR